MNRLKFYFGAFAAVALVACSDEPNAAGGNNGNEEVGDEAYMTISIRDVNNGPRATSNSFEYGEKFENNVSNAKFYFFDEDKNFILEANVWNGGSYNETDPDANIEYFGNNVLLLRNLKKTGYPKYLLTVLNAPADLKPVVGTSTLDAVRNQLIDIRLKNKDSEDTDFVMSTTSYNRGSSTEPYYANILSENNFRKEPAPAADDNPVIIYVERLAAKVRLNVASTMTAVTLDNGMKGYRVPASVSGNPNDQGGANEGVSDVYVTFEGWDLSNYEPKSYVSKNLDEFSTTSIGDWNWNASQSYRSYWAASPNYGEADPALFRNNLGNLKGTVDEGALYIPETTNTFANVQNNGLLNAKNVASIIVKAVVREKSGATIDLVRFQGINYRTQSFIAYGLQSLGLNYYIKEVVPSDNPEVADGEKYTEAYDDDVNSPVRVITVHPEGTATGLVVLKSILPADTELWKKESNGSYTKIETVVEEGVSKTPMEQLNEALASFTASSPAVQAYDGTTYYNIPIEHFATATPSITSVKQEGEYGVVRNHIYDVTIQSISKLGSGVFDPGSEEKPGEPIIPDDPQDLYYLSAKVNILSWKVVNQKVEL